MMHYLYIEHPGPESQLILKEGPTPKYSQTQVLVRVKATALNRADLLQRYGKYPPPKGESEIPGLEVSGTVVAVGGKVRRFKPGDRIYGLVGSGAYAEFCPVEENLAQLIPKSFDDTEAAALPEALTTVYGTLFDLGKLKAHQTLLIHGAGSGIASLAIQMAKCTNAFVVTTVGGDDKIAKAKALGADQVIDYKKDDFETLIEKNHVDLILDFVGGDYFNKHLNLLKPKGQLIQIACMKGANTTCNLALIIQKRLHIQGFVLRSQTLREKSRLWKLAHHHWHEALENKTLRPIIDSTFSLRDMERAHQYMQSSQHFGKIVIHV